MDVMCRCVDDSPGRRNDVRRGYVRIIYIAGRTRFGRLPAWANAPVERDRNPGPSREGVWRPSAGLELPLTIDPLRADLK